MSSCVIVGPDDDMRIPNDPTAIGHRAAELQTSAERTQARTLSALRTSLYDSSVLKSFGRVIAGLVNDFVGDAVMVKVFERDGGRRCGIS